MRIHASDIQIAIMPDELTQASDFDCYEEGADVTFIGVCAHLDIVVNRTIHTFQSGGLWGIESDSGEDYLQAVFQEEKSTLIDDLQTMGIDVE